MPAQLIHRFNPPHRISDLPPHPSSVADGARHGSAISEHLPLEHLQGTRKAAPGRLDRLISSSEHLLAFSSSRQIVVWIPLDRRAAEYLPPIRAALAEQVEPDSILVEID